MIRPPPGFTPGPSLSKSALHASRIAELGPEPPGAAGGASCACTPRLKMPRQLSGINQVLITFTSRDGEDRAPCARPAQHSRSGPDFIGKTRPPAIASALRLAL